VSHTKISIIGAGAVGTTTAYALMLKNITVEIILIDIDQTRCEGEILDLSDALSFSKTSKIISGTIEDARDSNIIVICAGERQKPGQKREELLTTNKKIISSIMESLKPINQNSIIVMVTNPVDIMTYHAQSIADIPKNQIFGTGTFLDTQRIRNLVAKSLEIDDQSVHAYTIGEHGETQFVAWSSASVTGKPIMEFPQINKNLLEKFSQEAKNKVYEIIKCKGATFFGIAACIAAICENIIFDRKYVLPLSILIKEFNICISMPVVLGQKGIEKIIEIPLNQDEEQKLQTSVEKLKKLCK